MKKLSSSLILAVLIGIFVYALSITGCNNTVTNSVDTQTNPARTEQDFVANSDLKARPGSITVVSLESWFSPPSDTLPDTGVKGEDLIPFRYTENTTLTFRMESTFQLNISFFSSETGQQVFYLDPFNSNVTANIPAGDYIMHINSWKNYSEDSTAAPQLLFIHPEEGNPLKMVISSGGCPNCDLTKANLKYMNFRLMDFRGANLTSADIGHSDLIGTNFSSANLNNTYFYHSLMAYADLSHSSMKGTILRSTDLQHANIGGSDLSNCDLRFSNISFANFCGSNLSGVITNGITTNKQTQCWP